MSEEELMEDLYFSFLNRSDEKNSQIIKRKFLPSLFYKYRTLNFNTIGALENSWLWMSCPGDLNDIFEMPTVIEHNEAIKKIFISSHLIESRKLSDEDIQTIKISKSPVRTFFDICVKNGTTFGKKFEEIADVGEKHFEKILQERIGDMRVCSFATSFDSILMWSHYSDNNKGICIEYDFTSYDSIIEYLHPVLYTNKRRAVDSLEEIMNYNQMLDCIVKAKEWQYEKEWRYVKSVRWDKYDSKLTKLDKKLNKLMVPKPTAIYLGTRFELNNKLEKNKFLGVIEKMMIPTFKMTIHKSEYKIIRQY